MSNIKFAPVSRLLGVLLIIAAALTSNTPLSAQEVMIPNFWDKNERFQKPDVSRMPRLRFLTTTDFPPFNFIDRKKRLSGFHIDLAREICTELEVLNRCEIQALPWEELGEALERGDGEVILAGQSVNEETRKTYNFSRPYIKIPGRFVARKDSELAAPIYPSLFRKKTAVIGDSAHAKFFEEAFSTRTSIVFATREEALEALQKKEVDAVFSDALSLSFWVTSSASNDCCELVDGAFESEKHFGYGLSAAVAKDRRDLVGAMDYALSRINESGKFAELYLRYFPTGLF